MYSSTVPPVPRSETDSHAADEGGGLPSVTQTYVYDNLGRVAVVEQPATGQRTQWQYDLIGRPLLRAQSGAAPYVETYEYERYSDHQSVVRIYRAGALVRVQIYNADGTLHEESYAFGQDNLRSETVSYEYYPGSSRLREVRYAERNQAIRYAYHPDGYVQTETQTYNDDSEPLTFTRTYTRDPLTGRLEHIETLARTSWRSGPT